MHGFLNDRPTDDDLDDFDEHAEYLLNFIGIVCMKGVVELIISSPILISMREWSSSARVDVSTFLQPFFRRLLMEKLALPRAFSMMLQNLSQ